MLLTKINKNNIKNKAKKQEKKGKFLVFLVYFQKKKGKFSFFKNPP